MLAVDFWNDQESAQKTIGRLKSLKSVLKPIDELQSDSEELAILLELGAEDEEICAEIPGKLRETEQQMEQLETQALLSGPFDSCDAILSINARDGGTDANDWAEMLLRMYTLWAKSGDYSFELIDRQDNEEAGINSASIIIRGPYAYGYLKGETGIHRLVRISPFNSEGKRQTSFAAVDVSPETDESIEIGVQNRGLCL